MSAFQDGVNSAGFEMLASLGSATIIVEEICDLLEGYSFWV